LHFKTRTGRKSKTANIIDRSSKRKQLSKTNTVSHYHKSLLQRSRLEERERENLVKIVVLAAGEALAKAVARSYVRQAKPSVKQLKEQHGSHTFSISKSSPTYKRAAPLVSAEGHTTTLATGNLLCRLLAPSLLPS
jgi:hypothetical protein